jgi:penicillin-binding protein 1C
MAGPLFFQLAEALRAERGGFGGGLARPKSLVRVPLCALTGGLPTEACPRTRRGWFWPGVSPVAPCDVHRRVRVDPATGRRLCRGSTGPAKLEVDEFWPSDLLRIFAEAGVPRRQPPAPEPGCSLDGLAASGLAPQIVSPMKAVTYAVRVSGGEASIPLVAAADADVRKVSWFLGDRLLGESSPREPLFWSAEPGRFTVRAVDDHGRSDSRELVVALEK